jgi:hypothetical protein
MADIEKTQQEIQEQLKTAGVSRRGFIDRVKALGFGFGAAFALGVEGADAKTAPDASLNLTSTNPALDKIINDGGPQEGQAEPGEKKIQEAWYRRFYRRFYRRGGWGGGYRRFYRRW